MSSPLSELYRGKMHCCGAAVFVPPWRHHDALTHCYTATVFQALLHRPLPRCCKVLATSSHPHNAQHIVGPVHCEVTFSWDRNDGLHIAAALQCAMHYYSATVMLKHCCTVTVCCTLCYRHSVIALCHSVAVGPAV